MCKPFEIYRMCDVYREACFSFKIFAIVLNMGLLQRARVEKTIREAETYWLSIKETVLETVNKEVHNVFWDMKGLITFDFPAKSFSKIHKE